MTPSQKTKPILVIEYTRTFTQGLPHELKLFASTKLLILYKLLGGSTASAVGATGEGTGCSLLGGMTFGSVEGRAMSTSDPGSVPSIG